MTKQYHIIILLETEETQTNLRDKVIHAIKSIFFYSCKIVQVEITEL